MKNNDKYLYESAVAARLLDIIRLPYTGMTDPLATYGRETGTDVEITHSGRKIGIQVTDFSADEGLAPPRRGLRATEARNAAKGQFPAYAIPLQHQLSALRLRVADKVAKASSYDFKEFHEVWLLIAAASQDPTRSRPHLSCHNLSAAAI